MRSVAATLALVLLVALSVSATGPARAQSAEPMPTSYRLAPATAPAAPALLRLTTVANASSWRWLAPVSLELGTRFAPQRRLAGTAVRSTAGSVPWTPRTVRQ